MATGAAWPKGRNSQGGREKQKHPYRKGKKKTYLTLTGLLMEGLERETFAEVECPHGKIFSNRAGYISWMCDCGDSDAPSTPFQGRLFFGLCL